MAGHPWIYAGEILRLTRPPADGELVQVKDHRQRLLGMGFFNSKSKINVRVLAPERIEVDEAFFEERIRAALAVRQKHLPEATSFRVVNAESDFLSGLIVDKYEDVLVVQISSLGMDQRKAQIVAALQKIFSPRAILERSDAASRKFEGLAEANGVLSGRIDGPCSVNLNGLKFETDLRAATKPACIWTSRRITRPSRNLPKAGRCWIASVFSAGSDCTRRARARRTCICWTKAPRRLKLRNETPRPTAWRRNARSKPSMFSTGSRRNTAVKPHERVIPRFDLIILDPPSFTRNRASVPDALRGYKEIHLRALKLLKPGGTLATFCCSHHVSAELFQDSLLSAAFDTRQILRRVATYAQSPDHPIIPMIPETEYLKGFAFEVVG